MTNAILKGSLAESSEDYIGKAEAALAAMRNDDDPEADDWTEYATEHIRVMVQAPAHDNNDDSEKCVGTHYKTSETLAGLAIRAQGDLLLARVKQSKARETQQAVESQGSAASKTAMENTAKLVQDFTKSYLAANKIREEIPDWSARPDVRDL